MFTWGSRSCLATCSGAVAAALIRTLRNDAARATLTSVLILSILLQVPAARAVINHVAFGRTNSGGILLGRHQWQKLKARGVIRRFR
ncbi:hypothetical protein [Actinoplanes sp. NPDC089786]|uniref:hypothetical protein n=1 Tax=Actinoplanes sp. NPDC089786 TaxID=3155185 RepID=UPI00343DFC67